MSDADKTKRLVIESLILAFANTKARSIVGTDALRSVLEYRYRELSRGGTFDLGPILELLEEQPGYDPGPVSAALLRAKSWEGRIGIEFKLPLALGALGDDDREALLADCNVPPADLARIIRGGEVGSEGGQGSADESLVRDGAPRARRSTTPVPRAPATGARAPLERKPKNPKKELPVSRGTAMLGAALGVAGLAFAGWYAAKNLTVQTPAIQTVPASFAGELPIAGAQRYANQVIATLRDDHWPSLPAAQRTQQLEDALRRLPNDVDTLLVREGGGRVRATAQWLKSPRRVVTKLH